MPRIAPEALGVYVHVPFCRAKCSYCAFVSHADAVQYHHPYVAALCREITAAGGDFSVPVDTVFFGGGTPTVLAVEDLASILQILRKSYPLTPDAEISLEANPGTVDYDSLKRIRQMGFNRISFGVQSLDDRVLSAIGRIHKAKDAETSVSQALAAGFENISVDLMYGLPSQTLSGWIETLEKAVSLAPKHISAYGLKLEEGTPLQVAVANGLVSLPSEEEEEAMYDLLNDLLPSRGFNRYEISNFATAGYECRHNLKYWSYQQYRGFGVAAHSFDGTGRFANTEDLSEYLGRMASGRSPEDFRETPDELTSMAEFVILALRTTKGLVNQEFKNAFGCEFFERFAVSLTRLKKNGMIIEEMGRFHLTKRGMKLGNQAFTEFLP